MKLFRVTHMTFDETMTNSQLLAVYPNRNETLAGTVTVPVHTQSIAYTFKIDITQILPLLPMAPEITFRLHSDVRTESQFEFASRENATLSSRPFVEIMMNNDIASSMEKQRHATAVRAHKTDTGYLRIEGLESGSVVKLFGTEGRELYSFRHTGTASDVNLPLQRSWGKLIFVNVSGNNINETVKVLI
jgi:hypothetical protein